MLPAYQKVKVTEIPLSVFDGTYGTSTFENGEGESRDGASMILGDNGFASDENYGSREKELMLAGLTTRQRRIALLLADGYSRVEIAQEVGVCTQAVHQIILRIRKRLATKAGVNTKGWKVRHGRY